MGDPGVKASAVSKKEKDNDDVSRIATMKLMPLLCSSILSKQKETTQYILSSPYYCCFFHFICLPLITFLFHLSSGAQDWQILISDFTC